VRYTERMWRLVFLLLLASLPARVAFGRETEMLTFRSSLFGKSLAPTDAPVVLVFSLYDAASGGNVIAGPFGPLSVVPKEGELETTFGPVPAAARRGGALWLEVILDGSPLPRLEMEGVYYDGLDEHGALTGGRTLLPRPAGRPEAHALVQVTTILDNGPPSNRIDLVFVGDGYVLNELGNYEVHCQTALNTLLAQEPFVTYRNLFNAHRVDVVSNMSGVDNDPVEGIDRDTALDMGFFCSGIERLLCVDVAKAKDCAAAAPEVDQLLAVANSSKYGGAGYTGSDVATYSGGNSAAPEIAIHEMGHSLGELADEYDYGDGTTYAGPELVERNVSILDAAAMAAAGTKWASWLGDPGFGFDGLVSTFEGAYYTQYGIYRPTIASKMRVLGRPFNLPSCEGLILDFYQAIRPIDGSTPTGTALVDPPLVFVDPIDPVGHELEIQWFLDGEPIAGAAQESLQVAAYHFPPGQHALSVRVTDPTPLVRDEPAREAWMTESRAWDLQISPTSATGEFAAGQGRVSLQLWSIPNPFRRGTVLHYELPGQCRVEITLHDAAGRRVALLRNAVESAGPHAVSFDARNLPHGLFFFHLDSACGSVSRKALLLR